MKRIIFTVTNDLTYDQRMIRICTSLTKAGYRVQLVGRKKKQSTSLPLQPFQQKRLYCFFQKGKWFYAEYNIRLFFYLLFQKADCICAIDLDTILPCYRVSKWKKIPRVYDAHELFCEMKEVVTRPPVYRAWKKIEKKTVPHFKWGYTVSQPIAAELKKMYGVHYEVIRNVPFSIPLPAKEENSRNETKEQEKIVLYQGSVNEGRSFETLIPAMKKVNAKLYIAGDGNFMLQARQLVKENQLSEKVIFTGQLLPEKLRELTQQAYIGITLFENKGLSNYYSLGNRFFDYIQAGLPQLCVDYPAYREINTGNPVAWLIDDLSSDNIAAQLNRLLNDEQLYAELRKNCLAAREIFNWENEEKKLLQFYQSVFQS
jgi:glycosyltransferase involved in cell wall biosynthesis